MQRIRSLRDYLNFLSVVIVSAPSDFRKFDFLNDDEQLNLERAFDELNFGMVFISEKLNDAEKLGDLKKLLDSSLAAYLAGDKLLGAHLLQDFEEIAFQNE